MARIQVKMQLSSWPLRAKRLLRQQNKTKVEYVEKTSRAFVLLMCACCARLGSSPDASGLNGDPPVPSFPWADDPLGRGTLTVTPHLSLSPAGGRDPSPHSLLL